MSPASFPAPGTHPENFRYSVYNILEPVPEELRGRYDLVHVRLLVAALGKGDVDTAVRNLVLLLRPGGWIQWEDLDSYTWAGRVPSSHVKEMHALMRSHMEARGMEEHIPSAFVAAATAHQDLQNVSARAFNTLEGGTQHRDAFNKAFLWSCARSSKMILRARGEENVEAEATRLDEGARRDIERDGIFWDSDEHVLLAQRR
ncbi:uncharacterized protein BJX67DRAFT_386642 [Aspergillus lucknowensis]|uniref:Methyltransferase domain-containing protein n=1 Tax=Aspergillus lucknowensis TaxID=176173 RepID=A0ABR4L5L7_9EURO